MTKHKMLEQLTTAGQVLINLVAVSEPAENRFHFVVTTGVNGINVTLGETDIELKNQSIEFFDGTGNIELTENEFETVSRWFNTYNIK